jgi:tetratricopeptide (TPR) repeat protein
MGQISPRKFSLYACLLLALGTLALYWPVTGYPFINFDDAEYISDNPVVQAGLTWEGLKWAFNGIHVSNWHPLSWLSHMLDCQLFGLKAGGHHLVNLLFHIANTLLLFVFLRNTTGALWRSAFVAALFAWHPLHVESVAWIAERKDVLSTFFWLLALLAYTRYAKSVAGDECRVTSEGAAPPPATRSPSLFYALALLCSAAALLSKPMAVTLPFTLLLVDLWPLNRLRISDFKFRNLIRLVIEKIPFFALSFALCLVTFLAQRGGGAVCGISWSTRLSNVPVTYIRYIFKTLWPANLALPYPYIYDWSIFTILGSSLLLLTVSAWALLSCQRRGWLAFGWFYFLGTLVPVIGLVQVGMQSMADRYTYIPSIGLFVMATWGTAELCSSGRGGLRGGAILGSIILAGLLVTASIQISYWQNSTRLFIHAIETTEKNYVAMNGAGASLNAAGQPEKALDYFKQSVQTEPNFWPSRRNLALTLLAINQLDAAFKEFDVTISLLPNDIDLQYEVAGYLHQHGRLEPAKTQLEAILLIKPNHLEAHNLLGAIFLQQSKFEEAERQFLEALKLAPDFIEARLNLGMMSLKQNRTAEAVLHFQKAVQLAPTSVEAQESLGVALLANHQPVEARKHFNMALIHASKPARTQYYLGESWRQQGIFSNSIPCYQEALRLAPNFPEAQKALTEAQQTNLEQQPTR